MEFAEAAPAVETAQDAASQEDLLDAALDFLAELLGALDVAGDIAITHEDDNEVRVELQAAEDAEVLTANNGQAIQAIQYLMNVIYGVKLDRRVVVDVGDWRAQHEARLHGLAEAAALRVKESGKRFAFEPMPPSDRRQVHHYVKAHHGELVTYSIGEEPNRRIVLEPEGAEGPRPGEVPQRRGGGGGGRPPRNFDGRRGGAYQGRRQR